MLTDWTSVTVPASQSLGSKVTLNSQQLVPGATYQFRVFAVNSQGISASSPMSEHFYSAGWFANKMAKRNTEFLNKIVTVSTSHQNGL